ncbi:MAG: hypothetical protein PHS53_02980 [Candidatus Pacebacteria bacterium]|nr:hypothetical protein [Candidatus Paceibacterota bacterium]MDD5357084.1 hypothetical protein [Candidatus Paceibacterota bacterium]
MCSHKESVSEKERQDAMGSSKDPQDEVSVPAKVVTFAKENVAVCCNFPVQQRVPPPTRIECWSSTVQIDTLIWAFLRTVDPETTGKPARIALLLRGYGTEVGTVVADLTHILFCQCDVPRLDFVHPPEMAKINGCSNFWGPFILALAKVKDDTKLFGTEDKEGEKFIDVVRESGVDLGVRFASGPCKRCKSLSGDSRGKRELPSGCGVDDKTWVCPFCGQHWWQFNDHHQMWKATTLEEVLVVRRQEPAVMWQPQRGNPKPFTISDVKGFEDGEEVEQLLPIESRLRPGHLFCCDRGDGFGEIISMGCMAPVPNRWAQKFTVRRYPPPL